MESQGATVVSVQIPELEETRIAHVVTIGAETMCSVLNNYPNHVQDLVNILNLINVGFTG